MKNRILKKLGIKPPPPTKEDVIKQYVSAGRIPWSYGYHHFKWDFIEKTIGDKQVLSYFSRCKTLPPNFGQGIDDRSVEYPWLFSQLPDAGKNILDAGSTFNFELLVNQSSIVNNNLTVLTFFPEAKNYNEKRISYVYADLRNIPLRDNFFDVVVCQSTLEHIGMDNSIYGYDLKSENYGRDKDYSYLLAIKELIRVLKPGGKLLLTFPFGKYEFHGFFQQFDSEMLDRMRSVFIDEGKEQIEFIEYKDAGWNWSTESSAANCISFNPHTGIGKGDDGAAHSRALCFIKFEKKQ